MDKIIKIFIENPLKEYHVREIAKLCNLSPTTVSKFTEKLRLQKILLSRRLSNHLLFKANTENYKYKKLKREYNVDNFLNSGIISYIEEKFNYPEAIIIFGSYQKGEDNPNSDIDIAIITQLKKNIELTKFEKILKHKIQYFLFSKKNITNMKENNKELLNNIINGMVIHGFWEVFR